MKHRQSRKRTIRGTRAALNDAMQWRARLVAEMTSLHARENDPGSSDSLDAKRGALARSLNIVDGVIATHQRALDLSWRDAAEIAHLDRDRREKIASVLDISTSDLDNECLRARDAIDTAYSEASRPTGGGSLWEHGDETELELRRFAADIDAGLAHLVRNGPVTISIPGRRFREALERLRELEAAERDYRLGNPSRARLVSIRNPAFVDELAAVMRGETDNPDGARGARNASGRRTELSVEGEQRQRFLEEEGWLLEGSGTTGVPRGRPRSRASQLTVEELRARILALAEGYTLEDLQACFPRSGGRPPAATQAVRAKLASVIATLDAERPHPPSRLALAEALGCSQKAISRLRGEPSQKVA